jgi:hypothetical protein
MAISFANAPSPANDPRPSSTMLGNLIFSAWFVFLGILAVSFSIIQLVDAEHPKIWGSFILAGSGFLGFMVTFLVVLPFFFLPGAQDLSLLIISVAGPILGTAGGLWGLFWKNPRISQSEIPSNSRP